MATIGYMLAYLASSGRIWSNHALMSFFFFMTGLGSVGLYTASLAPNVHNFSPQAKGKVVGIIAALFGISAAIFTNIYKYAFSPNEHKLFLFFAVVLPTLALLSAIFLTSIDKRTSSRGEFRILNSEPEELSTQPPAKEILRGVAVELSPLQLFRNAEFYLLLYIFFAVTGPGLAVINNLGSLGRALGASDGARNNYVILMSVCNFAGRALFGIASDALSSRFSRGFWTLIVSVLMFTAHIICAYATEVTVYFGVILAGLGYGGIWCLMPAAVSELWGNKYYGTNFCIFGIGSALGSFFFATLLAAFLQAKFTTTTFRVRTGTKAFANASWGAYVTELPFLCALA